MSRMREANCISALSFRWDLFVVVVVLLFTCCLSVHLLAWLHRSSLGSLISFLLLPDRVFVRVTSPDVPTFFLLLYCVRPVVHHTRPHTVQEHVHISTFPAAPCQRSLIVGVWFCRHHSHIEGPQRRSAGCRTSHEGCWEEMKHQSENTSKHRHVSGARAQGKL